MSVHSQGCLEFELGATHIDGDDPDAVLSTKLPVWSSMPPALTRARTAKWCPAPLRCLRVGRLLSWGLQIDCAIGPGYVGWPLSFCAGVGLAGLHRTLRHRLCPSLPFPFQGGLPYGRLVRQRIRNGKTGRVRLSRAWRVRRRGSRRGKRRRPRQEGRRGGGAGRKGRHPDSACCP